MPRPLLAAFLVLAACGAPEAPAAQRVDRGAGPQDPLGAALHRVIVARAGSLEEVGQERRGTLGAGQTEESLVLHGGYCYAIFAQVPDAAGELSLRLLDDRSEPVQVDRERGASAILGLAEQLCVEAPTPVRLEIGSAAPGPYAMRIFRATAM